MNSKKKILCVAQAAGGVANYLSMLFKYIDRKQFECIFVCSKDYLQEEFMPLVDCLEYVDMQREIKFRDDLRAVFQLRKSIKKHNPDIVYLHSSKAGVIGRLAALGLKKKIVYNAHGWAFNMKCSKVKKNFYKYIEKVFAIFTNKIIAISTFEAESALKNRICSESKIRVIENGIDIAAIEKAIETKRLTRSQFNIPKNAYVVGMVGRITKQKAVDIFVEAANIIKTSIPDAYFIIVGDGDEHREIEQLIHKYNLESRFHITGWVKNPIDYMQLFDQAVLLSRWEGFGLVLAEYMLCKKPIVATSVDAIPNLIENNVNGVLVSPNNPKEVAQVIVTLYENQDMRNKLIENGLNVVKKRFDVKRVALQHKQLLKEVLKQTTTKNQPI